MWEIPSGHLKKWTKLPNLAPVHHAPRNVDIECPKAGCGRSIVNVTLGWKPVSDFLWTTCSCANCGQRTHLYLFNSPSDLGSEALGGARLFQYPKPSVQGPFEDGIAEVSPSFVEIHSQAQEAEGLGLATLVGIGYRKALEYLVKDYLVAQLPDKKEGILKATLAQCIANYVSDPKVKTCAERATWLGNDETHYLRTWVDKDLQDLKVLIKLTQYWISSEALTAQYVAGMSRKSP